MDDVNTTLLFILAGVIYMAFTLRKIRKEISMLNDRVDSIPNMFKSPAEIMGEIYKEDQ